VFGKHLFALVCLTVLTVAPVVGSTIGVGDNDYNSILSLVGDEPSTADWGDGFFESPPGFSPPYVPPYSPPVDFAPDMVGGNTRYGWNTPVYGNWDHGLNPFAGDLGEALEPSTMVLVGGGLILLGSRRGSKRVSGHAPSARQKQMKVQPDAGTRLLSCAAQCGCWCTEADTEAGAPATGW
jgi:hypothetical protein